MATSSIAIAADVDAAEVAGIAIQMVTGVVLVAAPHP